jgi:hypothetical protein
VLHAVTLRSFADNQQFEKCLSMPKVLKRILRAFFGDNTNGFLLWLAPLCPKYMCVEERHWK